MKKFVSYLALMAFAVASHMSTVHAWDMFGMEMAHGHSAESGKSIFCDDSPIQEDGSDCAKRTTPENAIVMSRSFEFPEPKAISETFVAFIEKSTSETLESAAQLATPPPRQE